MKKHSKNVSVNVKCPLCRESLMDSKFPINGEDSIKLNVQANDKRGTIRLCAIYGCYDHHVDIELPDNKISSFYCPHCNQEITSKETCEDCDATMIPFVLAMGGKVSFCSRNGCESHYIAFEDINDALRKFYYTYEEY